MFNKRSKYNRTLINYYINQKKLKKFKFSVKITIKPTYLKKIKIPRKCSYKYLVKICTIIYF